MLKFAIAFLGNPKPSLGSPAFFKGNRLPSCFLNTLAPDASNSAGTAWKLNDKPDCGSLQATPRAEKKAKTTGKSKRKAEANVEQELGHVNVASELPDIGVFKAAQNAAAEQAEEHAKAKFTVIYEERTVPTERTALHAEALGSIMNARRELSECVAKLDLHSYKWGHRWKETAYDLINYGIPSAHVITMLSKCRPSRYVGSPDSILNHFTMLGMSHEEMGRTISRWPRILGVSNNLLQCKVEFFKSVGFDKRLIVKMIHEAVITLSISTLRNRCDFWKGYLKDEGVNAFYNLISRSPHLLRSDVQKGLKTKIAYLEGQGYSKKILLRRPSVLNSSLEAIAMKSNLLEQFGISNTTRAVSPLDRISISKLHGRLNNLLVVGFSLDQVQNIILKFPKLLAYSEDRINLRLSYALNVMNLSLDTLVVCTMFWSCSYEKRIKYRYEIMQELITLGAYGKHISVAYMVNMSDTYFSTRFVKRLEAYTEQSNVQLAALQATSALCSLI